MARRLSDVTHRDCEDTSAYIDVTNLSAICRVHILMGWSPQIENRLREIRLMVPDIRAIVADHEPAIRSQLRHLLAAEDGVAIVAECRDALQTISAVRNFKPDLLLLDIEMQDADGFEVLKSISRDHMPIVIFTGAHNQHAMRAFEAHALDYLLKPLVQQRLHAAIERTRAELLKNQDHQLTHRILDLLTEARTTPQTERRLVIKTAGRVVLVEMDEIDWVEAAGNYVKLKTSSGAYLIREGISHLSDRLDPAQFTRIHRSVIVNLRRIKELQPCNRGEYIVMLKDGKQLSCSRSYRAKLQQMIQAL